jgi:hypothetical protein
MMMMMMMMRIRTAFAFGTVIFGTTIPDTGR